MGPGFKYHIVSISAIFFALTVGLVVGSVFVSPQFANRQQDAINKLQKTLNNDIEANRLEIKQDGEALRSISPLALKGKLAGGGVVIIQTGDYPDDGASAAKAIAMAQPRATLHLSMTAALDRNEDDVRASLADVHARNASIPDTREGLLQAIAGVLAKGDKLESPVLPEFEREGFVRLTPDDTYSSPIKFAVIVGGSRNADSMRAARVDVPLIRALLKQGISVVACEGQTAAVSDIPSYKSLVNGVATVDNVDSDIGRCALILAFGTTPAAYGVKPTAQSLLPPTISDGAP